MKEMALQIWNMIFFVMCFGSPYSYSSNTSRRFLGTNGTAYVVGGLGGSVYNRGGVTIATIKTGAGLRMGANVGYIKFSENPKWLPF